MDLSNWIKYVGVPGALLSACYIWTLWGFPTLAWSSDIQRLDRNQAAQAVDLYRGKVRNLILTPKPSNEPNATAWDEDLAEARRQRDAAEKRSIELGVNK